MSPSSSERTASKCHGPPDAWYSGGVGTMVEFGDVRGYLANGGGAGVALFHEWWGLVPQIKGVADRLAGLGFTVLAPDLYHGRTAAMDEVALAEELLAALDREQAVAEGCLSVAELRHRGCEKVATLGFCTGGAVSIATSAACRVDATVAYYGIWPKGRERSITNPILVHVAELEGDYNWTAQPAHMLRWFEGMSNAQVYIYEGCQHAFCNPERPDLYDEAAANLSWERTVDFLHLHLA